MPSLLNGLSAAAQGLASLTGTAWLESQKADLAMQQTKLADQLATVRESAGRQEAGQIAATAAEKAQTFTAAENASNRAAELQRTGMTVGATLSEGAANRRAQINLELLKQNAKPEQIKVLEALDQYIKTQSPVASGSNVTAPNAAPSSDGTVTPSTGASANDGTVKTGVPSQPTAAEEMKRKLMGAPAAGSEDAIRRALAADVAADPAFIDKTAGQKAAEIETRLAVATGRLTDPSSREDMAKGIAAYRLAPLTGFALTKSGGPETMARVIQLNPDYQEVRYLVVADTMKRFADGKQGDIKRALDVGVDHLTTIDQAAEALGNGDINALNRLKNKFLQEIGVAAPTTLNGLAQIVATEVLKATSGGVGGAEERQLIRDTFSNARSPEQFKEITAGYRQLMAGQLAGLKRQYEAGTGFKDGPFAFETGLSSETLEALKRSDSVYHPPKAPAASTTTGKQVDVDASLANARDALKNGAPFDVVAKRLRDGGIDPSRLLMTGRQSGLSVVGQE